MCDQFCNGFGANLASEFVKLICGELCYVFKYKSHVKDLDKLVKEIIAIRDREQQRVDHAIKQGDQVIHKDVQQWLIDVDQFIQQVAYPITGEDGRAKALCFKGCPNLITRYKFSKKAVKAANDGAHLMGKSFSTVSYRLPPQRTSSMYVDRDYEAFDSREFVLQEIMEALKDANVNRIGVYGMGGVGKTTLVNKVAWLAIEDKLFDDVAIAEVTQKPDNRKIQDKIASDLGLEFQQHENEYVRADRLRNKLKKGRRVLVVLDNIWAKPDFKAIGIPFGGDEKGIAPENKYCEGINDDQSQRVYKILLTSRRPDVLCNEMKTDKNFPLETLSDKEAQNLFWKIMGDNLVENSDFRTVGEEIVKKCAGLPLAVATIANALKNKSLYAWEDALDKLRASNPRSIPEIDEKLFSVIEMSFNLLQNDEAKSLFLLCSLMDVGRNMSINYLLRYGMGLGLFKDVYTLEKGRNRVHTLIDHLKASCLLIEGDNNSWVKMHEVVHTVAASIASTNKLMFNIQDVPNLNIVLEDKISENPTAISLPFRDISGLPERLGCPKLELFFLFVKSDHSLQIPDSFFEGMKQLKVIDFDGINLLSLPSSFGYLTNLQTLCLDECSMGDISTIGELKNLKILSLSRSNIEQLPEKIGQLTRLQLLDLSNCSSLKVIQANVISRLSRLEELYLDNSSVQWESGLDNQDGSNANLDELSNLSLLTTLNISFSDAKIIPPNLLFQQLKKFKILIGDVLNWSHRNEAARTLKLKLNYNSFLGYRPIKILLKRTEDLFLDELNGIQNVFYELDEEGFLNLKHLHAHNCSELLYIVNSAGRIHYNAFPILELLCLINLVNLEKIWHGPLKEASFNKLKTVHVNKCDGLTHLFSISMAKSLSQLQEIEVIDCKKLKGIFSDEDDEGRVHNESAMNSKIKFPQLHTLNLERLPKFTSFIFNVKTLFATNTASSEITTADDHEDFKTLFHEVEYPSLENLILSSISIEMIWPEQLLSIASYSQTLKRLSLENCNGLKFLFSSSMVKSFAHLQHLVLCNCESMEWVLDTKGQGGEESISFPKLLSLKLKDLPNITRFGIGNIIEFPLLNALIIENCPNLRTFFSNNTCRDMTLSNELGEMNSVENLQADNQPLFGDKVGLPSLEDLMVYQMQNLRKIWDDHLSLYSFYKIKYLRVKDCSKLLNIFPSAMLERLQRLEILEVMSCDSLEEVFELQVIGDQMTPVVAATQLRELHVCHLPNLKPVWNKDAQVILAYENLIRITVHSCLSLKNLFPASMANSLIKLEELEICSCPLEEIVAMDDKVDEAVIPRFMFPRLNSLTFYCLPVLNTFYPERHISEWPVLKKIEVSGCKTGCGTVKILASELQSKPDHVQCLFLVDKVAFPSLEELKLSYLPELLHLWSENSQSRVFQNLEALELSVCKKLKTLVPSSVSLPFLKTLDASECDELMSLVTLSTAKSLVKLRRINIADCKKIEEIITYEGDVANNDDRIVLKQLNYLRLHHLPSLTCFCHLGNHVIDFRSLEKVIVGHCPKMAMLERVVLKEGDDKVCWQGNLDSSGQELFKEMVSFEGLKYMKISEFPRLKKVWHDQLLPCNVFSNLTSLVVDQCVDMSCAISANLLQFVNNLEMLEIRNCDSLEQVFDLEELSVHGNTGLLLQLSHFYLIDLPRLSHICRSHQNILGFKNLKFLEVHNCDGLRYIFCASMFSGLKQLQEMKIINCAKLEVIITTEGEEDATDKIVLPQLNSIILESLPELTSFYSGSNVLECPSLKTITLNNCTEMEAFVFSDMKTHHLYTPSLFSDQVSFPELETLKVRDMDNLKKIWDDDQLNLDSFGQLLVMRIVNCNKLLNIFPSLIHGRLQRREVLKVAFTNLNILEVWNCDSVEKVLNVEKLNADEHLELLFPKLNDLVLKDLPNLKSFCYFNGTIELPFLSRLWIENCPNMETFISNFTPVRMITNKEPEERTSEKKFLPDLQPLFDEKAVFPKLKTLYLLELPKLHLWKGNSHRAKGFQNLKSLRVSRCHKLEKLIPSSMSLQNLTTLEVWNCHRLKSLFTRSAAESLVNLTKMRVSSSLMIENIIELQAGGEVKEDPIVFSELEYLKLDDLQRLESFCLGNYTLEFPYLKQVVVSGCPSMKIFSQGVLHTPRLQKVQLTDEECWEGNLNSTIQKLFKEMARFRGLKCLKPSQFPFVKDIWHHQALPISFFSNIRLLVVDDYMFMSRAIPGNLLRFLNSLYQLVLRNCDSVEEVFRLEELNGDELPGPLFPELVSLYLKDLPKLNRFCNFNGNKIELPSLSILRIENCPNMETFISNSTPVYMKADKELQEMTSEENFLADIQPLFDGKVAFPNLKTLLLLELPKLSHLWKENSHPSNFFQTLETLKILGCHKLEKLVPSSVSFQNLTTLEVLNCDGLRNLVTYATAESLAKLTRLKISDCKMIEEIIQQLGEEVKECIIFSQLKYLELDCLPSLMSFCSGNYAVEFPSLKQVIVKECPKMMIFSRGVLSTPKLQRLQLTELDDEGRWEDNLNSTIQKLFEEMNVQSFKDEDSTNSSSIDNL